MSANRANRVVPTLDMRPEQVRVTSEHRGGQGVAFMDAVPLPTPLNADQAVGSSSNPDPGMKK
ncbi:hypothetical protein FRB96_001108 [Tulasnella sp. 330]|nr:hypothetical protein FRB96_001108 [Tulasnella sp. 330]KAG8866988.1 hypothetical protein FRB97_003601 [Tulasnella sp. 331]